MTDNHVQKDSATESATTYRLPFYAARQAIRRHASGGNILIFATVLAMVIANIPAINHYYFDFWNQEVRLQIGDFNVFSHGGHPMNVLAFINDALMAVFFFSIGLETLAGRGRGA